METVASQGIPLTKRKIAFCVSKWSDTSTVLSWAWLRQYFLHRETDELVIFHTGKASNWKAGGPLGADLDTALQNYPHQVITVSGTLQSNISKVICKEGIDVVVLGEDFPRQSGFQIGSVSDWIRQNIICPFIIIRASAVRNDKLRLGSRSVMELVSSPNRSIASSPLSPESAPGRKVAIAYSSYSVGVHLMELAKQLVLLPQDEIFVVHCFSGEKSNVMKQTKSLLLRTITLGLASDSSSASAAAAAAAAAVDEVDPHVATVRRSQSDEVTEESSLEFGAKELAGWENVHLGVTLRGDPRNALTSFCQSEGIELLVISTRMASFIRKTLTGGSVSGFLIDKAPCPCLVAPLKKSTHVGSEEEEGPLSPFASGDGAEWAPVGRTRSGIGGGGGGGTAGGSPELSLSPSIPVNVEALQAQLAEKDRIIKALRDEVARLRLAAAEKN